MVNTVKCTNHGFFCIPVPWNVSLAYEPLLLKDTRMFPGSGCICVWSSGPKEQAYCLHSKVRGTGTWKAPLIQTRPSNGYTWHAGDNSLGKEWKGAGQLSGTLSKKEGETEVWERRGERERGKGIYMENLELWLWFKLVYANRKSVRIFAIFVNFCEQTQTTVQSWRTN